MSEGEKEMRKIIPVFVILIMVIGGIGILPTVTADGVITISPIERSPIFVEGTLNTSPETSSEESPAEESPSEESPTEESPSEEPPTEESSNEEPLTEESSDEGTPNGGTSGGGASNEESSDEEESSSGGTSGGGASGGSTFNRGIFNEKFSDEETEETPGPSGDELSQNENEIVKTPSNSNIIYSSRGKPIFLIFLITAELFNNDLSDPKPTETTPLPGDETPNYSGDEQLPQNGMSKTSSAEFFEDIIKNKFRNRFSPLTKLLEILGITNDSWS